MERVWYGQWSRCALRRAVGETPALVVRELGRAVHLCPRPACRGRGDQRSINRPIAVACWWYNLSEPYICLLTKYVALFRRHGEQTYSHAECDGKSYIQKHRPACAAGLFQAPVRQSCDSFVMLHGVRCGHPRVTSKQRCVYASSRAARNRISSSRFARSWYFFSFASDNHSPAPEKIMPMKPRNIRCCFGSAAKRP